MLQLRPSPLFVFRNEYRYYENFCSSKISSSNEGKMGNHGDGRFILQILKRPIIN